MKLYTCPICSSVGMRDRMVCLGCLPAYQQAKREKNRQCMRERKVRDILKRLGPAT